MIEWMHVLACRDQAERLPWADEVFFSKADFDDKKQRMADLEGQGQQCFPMPPALTPVPHLDHVCPICDPVRQRGLAEIDIKQREHNSQQQELAVIESGEYCIS